MSYAQVPTASRAQIRKAGDTLKGTPYSDTDDWIGAYDLASQWRACHAYPINTFNVTLRKAISRLAGDPIAAQRLKRMPTIIDKLRRYPAMNLVTMQDIAGVRAIVATIDDVYKIAAKYKKPGSVRHELYKEVDHIQSPRDQDGYRSLHLMFKYKNIKVPSYNDLRIEMQIRTKLQHTWATAVETMGTFLGQALKSRQGNQRWLDFFALVATVFAHREGTPPPPRFASLSSADAVGAMARADQEIAAVKTMEGIQVAVESVPSSRASFYHLIMLDSINRKVAVKAYERDNFDEAVRDYARYEAEAAAGRRIEPVLVSAGSLAKLRRAYSSFFLDINEFLYLISGIISSRDGNV